MLNFFVIAVALINPVPQTRKVGVDRRGVLSAALVTATCQLAAGVRSASAIPPLDMVLPPEQGGIPMPTVEPAPLVMFTPPAVKGLSSPENLALAKHLQKKGDASLSSCIPHPR